MKKGFTLLELLIVIGILAILATAVILVINPAELLAEARDSQRVTDLEGLNKALTLYVTSVNQPFMAFSGGAPTNDTCLGGAGTYTCYTNSPTTLGVSCGGRYGTAASVNSTANNVNGTGWLPVNLTSLSGGSPLAVLPNDPVGDASKGLYYGYACSAESATANKFVLTAVFESGKYNDDMKLPANDGGPTSTVYEVGTYPGLDM